ncbi:hypothetical protein GUITHDRAFT_80493 [Guillardia theta CCMP2712]|uniref:N-acetyltransferase domain-containing protein n=1 Tax=Guillardia theta (strain CCMP2712) TaxID=905079 RepID=L1IF12_GUITC|nr:hypothetical protein GUITHDRAFT_80493 [Guillardia theta CCMP2712]EKX34509.1 hypothetical protein GUITHDRAFT_80493 [Guillardia theta CCMP2712]|eukprot:XP_005821489.1 hypothetical protein GUITHDRAFT_80493 [Guillardia theta CCMP2712]
MLRAVQRDDIDKLVQLGKDTGIFGPGEADDLLGKTIVDLLDAKLPSGHQAHVLQDDVNVLGWMYFGPTEDDPNVWNLWWIGVDPKYQGKGYGKNLLHFFEATATKACAKEVMIETSSAPLLERTRAFYTQQGYCVSRTEPDAYGPGEAKVLFTKAVNSRV